MCIIVGGREFISVGLRIGGGLLGLGMGIWQSFEWEVKSMIYSQLNQFVTRILQCEWRIAHQELAPQEQPIRLLPN